MSGKEREFVTVHLRLFRVYPISIMQLEPWWPAIRDKEWTWREAVVAGVALKGAVAAGVSRVEAERIAEIAGYKNLIKGIVYPAGVEEEIRRLRSKLKI